MKRLRIEHRFVLSGASQQLLLLRTEDLEDVSQIITLWRSGDLPSLSSNDYSKPQLSLAARPAPLTLSMIFLGFVGAALAAFGPDFIVFFTFWDPSTSSLFMPFFDFDPWIDIARGEFWRLITPVFLHFGPVHIIFNALWIWYLGTVVEFQQGKLALLVLALAIGIGSNIGQALVSPGVIFGGLSGVVYGLFAYVWLYGVLNPESRVKLPHILFVVITALMLISPTGIFDIMAGGEVADTAHISGYIIGLFSALIATFVVPKIIETSN